ncbi:Protein of uncharacterised function (DUF1351) [Sebaldella termitidis]|uniref:Uncharacterized protein n=1 Tax=Sebaldella termitidis (strain ATCC 33386 / NCTC 11300) TaxID=526218 RepID=D1AH70_SEBTE|nr:DUF1351 domain-containing protein [Sebaldella termitidis]ACZ08104.1 hypothetical protein Sterm_1236 [Sebaldella termitidis ATCC 33386]SUI23405.1 Protein of uncharacterised function (DUF1351) [Sebaldella termitidis]
MDEFQLETKVTQQIAIQTNIEKLDTFLEEIRNKYAGTIVTEDIVTSSKKDRANLNKIVAKLKEAKKYVEEKGKEGISEFLEKIDSAVKEISDISNSIDVQIKSFEEEEKEKKVKLATAAKSKILAEMNIPEEIHEFIKLDSKITNKTFTLKKIEEDITIKASKNHDKYNYILKEIEKNNANLINKITFDDVKSIFDTEISNIIPRIETTANFRRAQEEKVKEKAAKEKQEAVEKALEEERKKIDKDIEKESIERPVRNTDDFEKNLTFDNRKKISSKDDYTALVIKIANSDIQKAIRLKNFLDNEEIEYDKYSIPKFTNEKIQISKNEYYEDAAEENSLLYVSEEYGESRRWSITKYIYYRRESDGRIFGYWKEEPATEMQEGGDFASSDCFYEVEQKIIKNL